MKYLILFLAVLSAACTKGDENKKEWGYNSYIDGASIQKVCETRNEISKNMCLMYILGVTDSQSYVYEKSEGTPWLCGEPKPEDLANATRGFLQAHPEFATRTAGALVIAALGSSFACDNDAVR